MGKILEINGPLVKLELPETVLGEQVRVGRLGLVGEVIGRDGDTALAQLYEDTAGLRPGEVAEGLGWPLSVELGPGLLNAIFDGVQRPLNAVWEQSGDRIARGVRCPFPAPRPSAGISCPIRIVVPVRHYPAATCWARCRKPNPSSTAS
jgi:V/A-type H+-transporting ATPase subunit A